MNIKLLAVAVAGILLSGCNDDNGELNNLSVQAFDPAIMAMEAKAVCTDGTTETSITGYDGKAHFFKLTPQLSPETCLFTFTGGNNAVDVSNGKSMAGVRYTIPKGMAKVGSPVTASPLTTLIAKELGNAEYSELKAKSVLTSLGLGGLVDSLANDGVDVAELLSNTEAVLAKLTTTRSADASKLAATTAVLSDVLVAAEKTGTTASDASVTDLAKSVNALAQAVILSEPNFPKSKNNSEQVVKITVTAADIKKIVDAVEAAAPNAPLPTAPKQTPVDGKQEAKPTAPITSGGTTSGGVTPSGGAD